MDLTNTKRELGDLIGSVFQTIRDQMDKHEIDEETKEEVMEKLVSKYEKEKLRFLSAPGETRSAIRKPRKSSSSSIIWIFHPKTKDFSWSSNLTYNGKKFVKDNSKQVIVATIDDDSIKELDEEDKIFLKSKGLSYQEVDISED